MRVIVPMDPIALRERLLEIAVCAWSRIQDGVSLRIDPVTVIKL